MLEGVQVFKLEVYRYVFALKAMIISMHTPFNIDFIFDAGQNIWLLPEIQLSGRVAQSVDRAGKQRVLGSRPSADKT